METDIYSGVDVVWMPGDKVAQYTLGRPLARGGMAELHLATVEAEGEPVVLKRVRRDYADRSDVYVLFEREAELAATLDHPNIVKVLEVLDADGDPVIVMEYLRGWDVRRMLKVLFEARRRMPLDIGVRIVQRALRGLQYAHTKRDPTGQVLGVVHRDISPSNVFVTANGQVKLLDFGIAKLEQATPTTLGASPKGKRAYMSPEQCRGQAVDRRADLFAIAAVLYELTTMKRAFDGGNDMAVLLAILSKTPTDPTEIVEGFPADLARVIMRGLSQEVDARYDSAQAMHDDLVEVAQAQGLHASEASIAELLADLGEIEKGQLAKAGGRTTRRPEAETQGSRSGTSRSGRPAPTGFGAAEAADPEAAPSSSVPVLDPPSESGAFARAPVTRASEVDDGETPDPAADRSSSLVVAPAGASRRRLWPLVGVGVGVGAVAMFALRQPLEPRPAELETSAMIDVDDPDDDDAPDASSPAPIVPREDVDVPAPTIDDHLHTLGDRALAGELGYDRRRELVAIIGAEGRADDLDGSMLLELDLAQAVAASSPCAAAHAGVQRAMATEDDRWLEPMTQMVQTVAANTECPGLQTAADAARRKLDPPVRKKRPPRTPPVEVEPPVEATPPPIEATPPPEPKSEPTRHSVGEKLDRLREPEL